MYLLVFFIALISMLIISTVLGFFTVFIITKIEKKIQWGNKPNDEWKRLGIDNPGERLHSVSTILAAIDTTITKTIAFLSAYYIFQYFGLQISILFIIFAGFLFVTHDLFRIKRFIGNSGIWNEIGYLLGDLISLLIAVIIFG